MAACDLEKKTLVVLTVDHGPEIPRGKWELYDPGIKTGLIMRWTEGGLGRGLTCPWLTSNVDVVPTVLELVGLPLPDNLDGRSCAPFFRDANAKSARDAVFAMMHQHDRWQESRCVRTRRYKLIRSFTPGRLLDTPVDMAAPRKAAERPVAEIFDLSNDPAEQHNLVGRPESQAAWHELNRTLRAWLEEMSDPVLRGHVTTPYYGMAMTDLTVNCR